MAFSLSVVRDATVDDEFDGSLLVFAVDIADRVIAARVARINTYGEIEATQALHEERRLFELAYTSGGQILEPNPP